MAIFMATEVQEQAWEQDQELDRDQELAQDREQVQGRTTMDECTLLHSISFHREEASQCQISFQNSPTEVKATG